MRSKYSPELASQILDWISRVSGEELNTDGSEENFVSQLRDGIVLCKCVDSRFLSSELNTF